jgi:hypothetical protein
MKRFLPIVLLLAFCLSASADPTLPRDIVREAVLSAQTNKLREFLQFVDLVAVSNQKDDPMPPQECVSFLKKIDAKALAFPKWEGKPKAGEKFDFTITAPVRVTFVILCTGFPDGEPRFKIVGLTRHER